MAFDPASAVAVAPDAPAKATGFDPTEAEPVSSVEQPKFGGAGGNWAAPDFIPQARPRTNPGEMVAKANLTEPIVNLPKIDASTPKGAAIVFQHPVEAGVYNAAAPLISSFTSPANIALLVTTGGLGNAAVKGSQMANLALKGIAAYFAGSMADDALKQTQEAKKAITKDSSVAEDVESVAKPILTGSMAVLAGLGAVHDIRPDLTPTLAKAEPKPAADLLRQEAAKAPAEQKPILEKAAEELTKAKEQAPNFDAATAKPVVEERTNADQIESPTPEVRSNAEPTPPSGQVAEGVSGEPEEPAGARSQAQEEASPPVTPEQHAKDYADYQQIQAEWKAELEKGGIDMSSPKMQELWRRNEEIKNRYDGFPPPAPENAFDATSAKPVDVERATGIKNASVDAELKRLGLEEGQHGESKTMQLSFDEAKAREKTDSTIGARLVDELADNPRAPSDTEVALVAREAVRRRLAHEAADNAYLEAVKSGDPVKIEETRTRLNTALADYTKAMRASDLFGTKQSQAFNLRKAMLRDDYSLAAMERKKLVANDGEPLSDTQRQEIRELHDQLEELQTKLDAREKQLASREVNRPPRKRSHVSEYLSKQAESARKRIQDRMRQGRVLSGIDPADLADHVIVGADYLARGVTDVAVWSKEMVREFGDTIKPYLGTIYDRAKEAVTKASKLEAFKTRARNTIDKLETKIEEGDFTREKRTKQHLDEEANLLQAQIDLLRQEFNRGLELDRYKRSSAWNKVKENTLNAYDLARSLMTTGEFSFILRQGKFSALAHPLITAKALPDTFKALVSDAQTAHALDLEIVNHPDYPNAKAAGLHIVDESAPLSIQEELFMGKLIGKVPLLRNFNQAARVFLNKIRFDVFEKLRKSAGGLNELEQKQIATFINESTGRGSLGKYNPAAVAAGRVLFAPRFLASRIQMAVGHSLWGGTAKSRQVIAAEYAKTLVGLGLYYSLLMMALGDDKKKPQVMFDARSSDFGKVKLGNTRLDPLAGLAQVITLAGRLGSGEKLNSHGRPIPIRGPRVPYGGDKSSDVLARFVRSKLHPVPGAIINLFDGTDLGGNEATIENQAANMMAPLTYVDVYQALKEQNVDDGTALSLLAILGEGLQTYDSTKRKKPSASKK